VSAEEVFTLKLVLGCFRGVNRHPSEILGIEFSPTMIAGDYAVTSLQRKRKSDSKTRRYAECSTLYEVQGSPISGSNLCGQRSYIGVNVPRTIGLQFGQKF